MELKINEKEIVFDVEDANKKIAEMITMQRALDNDIYTKKNVVFDMSKCYMALIDEIGEFTHELKNGWVGLDGTIHAPWCWWKDHLNKPSREKMVEEYIDMWHFAMSIFYHFMDEISGDDDYSRSVIESMVSLEEPLSEEVMDYNARYHVYALLGYLSGYSMAASILMILMLIGLNYEIYPDEIYKVYKEKNAVNYQRLKEGY